MDPWFRQRYLDLLGSIYVYNEHRGYTAIDRVLDALASIPRLSLSDILSDLPGESLLPEAIARLVFAFRRMASDVEGMWNGVLQFVTDAAQFIKANKPNAGDSFDTLIGYFCGIWDGIIDAVSGLLELAIGSAAARELCQSIKRTACRHRADFGSIRSVAGGLSNG